MTAYPNPAAHPAGPPVQSRQSRQSLESSRPLAADCLGAGGLGVRLFHVSPTDFAPGDRLVPGAVAGRVTTRDSSGARVYLTDTLEAARVWARYIGERSCAARVAIYDVSVTGCPVPAAPRRGVPQATVLEADDTQEVVVLGCLEWVDPWAGRPAGYREAMAAIPF